LRDIPPFKSKGERLIQAEFCPFWAGKSAILKKITDENQDCVAEGSEFELAIALRSEVNHPALPQRK